MALSKVIEILHYFFKYHLLFQIDCDNLFYNILNVFLIVNGKNLKTFKPKQLYDQPKMRQYLNSLSFS